MQVSELEAFFCMSTVHAVVPGRATDKSAGSSEFSARRFQVLRPPFPPSVEVLLYKLLVYGGGSSNSYRTVRADPNALRCKRPSSTPPPRSASALVLLQRIGCIS